MSFIQVSKHPSLTRGVFDEVNRRALEPGRPHGWVATFGAEAPDGFVVVAVFDEETSLARFYEERLADVIVAVTGASPSADLRIAFDELDPIDVDPDLLRGGGHVSAVVVGLDVDQFRRLSDEFGAVDGLLARWFGTTDDGLAIVELWATSEHHDHFVAAQLRPVLDLAGVDPCPSTVIRAEVVAAARV